MPLVRKHHGDVIFNFPFLISCYVSYRPYHDPIFVAMHCEGFSFFSPAGVQDADLSVLSQTMAQCCKNIKETVQMLASRHKDIHGSVSKVGKAIDRVRTGSYFV